MYEMPLAIFPSPVLVYEPYELLLRTLARKRSREERGAEVGSDRSHPSRLNGHGAYAPIETRCLILKALKWQLSVLRAQG